MIIVLNAMSGHCQEWREVSIHLGRSIGSARAASDFLGGTYVGMLKALAQVQVPGDVTTSRYYVYFFVSFRSGQIRICKAIVLWRSQQTFEIITELARMVCRSKQIKSSQSDKLLHNLYPGTVTLQLVYIRLLSVLIFFLFLYHSLGTFLLKVCKSLIAYIHIRALCVNWRAGLLVTGTPE
ncbi:uncharacterized protein LOC132721736 [Ruditapes philippinarum]|uniref:uncharacterized protein LOC132721736 n=1 Tax=Ruditapes philippinarum TaxID=129788 RepID=UPI00295C3618|nr:uncharacterized protein LOC132721736 [Ruditapes philippinarum]